MAGQQLQAQPGDQLKGGQPVAKARLQRVQQRQRVGGVAYLNQGGGGGLGGGEQLEGGGGDDAQRAFGANQQLFEVVAGVVLAQARQAIQHAAVGQHRFQAQGQLAHRPIAQHRHAAGIGGQIAADLAAAFRGQRQRKQPAHAGGGVLHLRQRAAGFGGQGVVVGIHRAQRVQAVKLNNQRVAAVVRGGGTAVRSVAALRHHRHASGHAGTHQRRHFGSAAGPRQCYRAALVALSPVQAVWGQLVGVSDQVAGADNPRQSFKPGSHAGIIAQNGPVT